MTNEAILEMLALDAILNAYPSEDKYDVEKMQARCDDLVHEFLSDYVIDKSVTA